MECLSFFYSFQSLYKRVLTGWCVFLQICVTYCCLRLDKPCLCNVVFGSVLSVCVGLSLFPIVIQMLLLFYVSFPVVFILCCV